jgi:hypothetical protein
MPIFNLIYIDIIKLLYFSDKILNIKTKINLNLNLFYEI